MAKIEQKSTQEDLTSDKTQTARDYAVWKEAKVHAALAESEDRSVMIPASEVWERFGGDLLRRSAWNRV